MHCRCSGPACGHGWWHHVTEGVGGWGVCPDFPLITVQDQRAISWGGWEVFGVPVSLRQHQREISMPCWCVWVCECVYMLLLLLFSPPPSLCYWEEKGRDIAIVTMPQLIGRTAVVVVSLARRGECAERASRIWKLWDEALSGGPGHVCGFSGPLQGHWKSQSGPRQFSVILVQNAS